MDFWTALGWVLLPLSLLLLHASGFRFIGKNLHPLSFTLLVQIFALTLPGVIGIALFDWPMSYDTHLDITDATHSHVLYATLISVALLLSGIAAAYRTGAIPAVEYRFEENQKSPLTWLTLASAFCIALKLLTITQIPILLALQGDPQGAAEAKMRILTQAEGVTVFGLNYVVRAIPFVSFFAAFLARLHGNRDTTLNWLFLSNVVLGGFNALYDVQKFQIVLMTACCFWLVHAKTGRLGILVGAFLSAAALSVAAFAVTLGLSGEEAALGALTRIFTGQSEGLFYIFQYLDPSPAYAWLGIPLGPSLLLPQVDPAAVVVQILFPGAGDTWLNSNTYLVAHAWAILGDAGIVLAPVFVLLNIVLISLLFRRAIKQSPALYYPLYFWLIVRLPIINVFTEFMWFKVFLDFLINMIFIWLISRLPQLRLLTSTKHA